jgi:hypothetical protein
VCCGILLEILPEFLGASDGLRFRFFNVPRITAPCVSRFNGQGGERSVSAKQKWFRRRPRGEADAVRRRGRFQGVALMWSFYGSMDIIFISITSITDVPPRVLVHEHVISRRDEGLENVLARRDADWNVPVVDHREPVHFVLQHHPRRLGDVCFGFDAYRGGGHGFTDGSEARFAVQGDDVGSRKNAD